MINPTDDSGGDLAVLVLLQSGGLGLHDRPVCSLCLRTDACRRTVVMVALCESLFSLLLLCRHVNMSFYFCGQFGCIFALVCKATN